MERGDEKGCRTIVEESPVGSKGSNGIVERAVQTIEGQIRVMKLALEARIGREIDAEANVVTFMAEYAGYLVNRLEVGKDGKSADVPVARAGFGSWTTTSYDGVQGSFRGGSEGGC